MSLHSSAVERLTRWRAPDVEQDSLRHTYLAFLAANPDACLRRSASGHLTASAVVLDDRGTHTLLTLHPRIGRWVQLGGHMEPDDPLIDAAALREATEESGLSGLRLTSIARLHTHPITCSLGVPTRHLDVQFCAVARRDSSGRLPEPAISDESTDLAWWPVDALPENADTPTLRPLIAAGVRLI
ncbi:NUDIX domain-containing protein [Gordonia sp. TBRC 11910]|uniref:NUDIX domain-containing protein n=1 Tax=Gordonia asplenii TaxID=2725283 RepID=A0A848KUW6_9ACTN|nr:NUDIX domain-containing protein [Gordonia asplenii]NMO02039.1 NUDIX domain-containing protein [Gordonia asplenii]